MEDDKSSLQLSQNKSNQDKSVPEQALDYYTKYSLNRELPKYFCGASSFEIGDWHGTQVQGFIQSDSNLNNTSLYKGIAKPTIKILDNISENPKIIIRDENNDENIIASSPASSVASNRKLEWDNGADIGYNNVVIHRKLQKSISLPTLSKCEYNKLQDELLGQTPFSRHVIEVVQVPIEHVSSNENSPEVEEGLLPISSSSSSAGLEHRPNSFVSSSASNSHQQLSSDDNSHALGLISACLQNKIGVPIAESTPFSVQNKSYLKVDSSDINSTVHESFKVDINMADKVSHYKHFKMLRLSRSKPMVVECVRNLNAVKHAENKFIQTTLVKNISVGLQTDSNQFTNKVLKPKHSEQQSVFYMYHSESDAEQTVNNSSAQTSDSEILSNNCQSFEFLCGDELNNKTANNLITNLQRFSPKSNLSSLIFDNLLTSSSSQDNSNTSTSSPLAQLLASHESKHRITDFQKKVRLLQNMLRSHKYKDSTKKFYLKQVLKKMFDTRYSDDTICECSKIQTVKMPIETDDKDESPLQQNGLSEPIQLVTENKNLKVQTFYNEILPKEVLNSQFIPIENIRQPRSHFLSLSNNELDYVESKNSPSLPPSNADSPIFSPSTHPLNGDQTWRDNKTRSEQILEGIGDGDSATHKPVEKEYDEDLAWINKEILNLNKLKKQLKQNQTEKNIKQSVLHKPRIQDLEGPKQSTTVYVLTTETAKDFVCHKCTLQTCTNPQCVGFQSVHNRMNTPSTHIRKASVDRNEQLENFHLESKIPVNVNSIIQSRFYPETLRYRQNSSHLHHRLHGSELVDPHTTQIESVPKYSTLLRTQPKPRAFEPIIASTNPKLPMRFSSRSPEQEFLSQPQQFAIPRKLSPTKQDPYFFSRTNGITETHELPRAPSSLSNAEAFNGPVQSYTIEIPICSSTKGEHAGFRSSSNKFGKSNDDKTCKEPCNIQKTSSPFLVQQLVSLESFTCNNNKKSNFKAGSDQARSWVDTAENVNKRKCTCCPECLKKIDKKVLNAATDKKSMHSSSKGSYIQGHIVESPTYSNNKANRVPSSSTVETESTITEVVNKNVALSHTTTNSAEVDVEPQVLSTGKGSTNQPDNTADSRKEVDISNKKEHVLADGSEKLDKPTQTSNSFVKTPLKSSTSTSYSSSQTSSTSSDSMSEIRIPVLRNACRCCNRQAEIKSVESDPKYVLCQPCYTQNRHTPYYTYPGHVCKCHAQTTQILQEIRDTVKELNMLENDNYCTCHSSVKQSGSDYCLHCKCKIKDKHDRKKGIAYVLTLEPEDKRHQKNKKYHKPSLEEIILKVPNYKSKQHYKKHIASNSDEEFNKENSVKKHKEQKNKNKKKSSKKRTLQDYLFANKPNFIASAEERRRCLIDLAYLREQRCLKYKQLIAALADLSLKKDITFQNFHTSTQESGPKHLFTAAEMKHITAKHYKALPEVQQKLIDNREKQIKKANKLLTDIFNQKLRQQTLRGKLTIPTTTSIIKLD